MKIGLYSYLMYLMHLILFHEEQARSKHWIKILPFLSEMFNLQTSFDLKLFSFYILDELKDSNILIITVSYC